MRHAVSRCLMTHEDAMRHAYRMAVESGQKRYVIARLDIGNVWEYGMYLEPRPRLVTRGWATGGWEDDWTSYLQTICDKYGVYKR